MQAIGYKEFYDYYQNPTEENLAQGKQRLLSKTMDYTRYQIKWLSKRIRRMFSDRVLLEVHLDDPTKYESDALDKAYAFY